VELADSVAITPHKMLGVPITCSFLLGRDVGLFHEANSVDAGYLFHTSDSEEIWDLGDLTPQCGRKGDALKMFLGWTFYGREGYARMIENAFKNAEYLFDRLATNPNFVMVSKAPLPCLQVCFYWARKGILSEDKKVNDRKTENIVRRLVMRGYMVDYAPGERGKFFRVVIGRETRKETVDGLVKAIEEVAEEVERS